MSLSDIAFQYCLRIAMPGPKPNEPSAQSIETADALQKLADCLGESRIETGSGGVAKYARSGAAIDQVQEIYDQAANVLRSLAPLVQAPPLDQPCGNSDIHKRGRVLLVDDDPRVLEGLRRTLQFDFDVSIAACPKEALAVLAEAGPFAVVVSDLRMPVMDGVQFLSRVNLMFPDTIRIMLTGRADTDSAIAAVNEGDIFRFLTKPCPPLILRRTISSAIQQHRLIAAERNSLRKTITGVAATLTAILGALRPQALEDSFRIKRYVNRMAEAHGGAAWQFEVAAALSQIGRITVPAGLCGKAHAGAGLSEEERREFHRHPLAAAEYLKQIPRFESIAQMIALQHKPFCQFDEGFAYAEDASIAAGAQMLRVAVDIEGLRRAGLAWEPAIASLRQRRAEYNPALLDALECGGDAFANGTEPRAV